MTDLEQIQVAMQTRQVGLEGTGEIKLRHLVEETLRMRPSRIVRGQIRGCETSAPGSGAPELARVRCPL